ncbi:putative LOC107380752-like protein [Nothobranchius furzeri]|uniref:LOC107380752-like protein n=1 Tax=Nothobranchius furzeri TaxID=105023 RepID=A0A9D2YEV6_NOTFU|nr:putative LOC107380752-like protein [Nothobranchius furzeri]
MASKDSSAITFAAVFDNSFYFNGKNTGYDEDSFKINGQPPMPCWIQSYDRKFLVVKNTECIFEDRNLGERKQHDSSFRIQVYRNTELQQQTKAVMLYSVDQDEKVMVVCCRTDTEVCPEAMNLADLQNIKDSGHKAMFFMTNLKNDTYMFESTLHKGKFLSFEPSQDSCLHKLILHPYEVDDTDHTINMIVSKEK